MAAKSPTEIPGYFGHADVGFVCDNRYVVADLADAVRESYKDFGESLLASGLLPPLGAAPVSAWMLARLAALSGRGFPLQADEEFGSDSDDYWG
jgi:hypothetical protein